MNELGLTIAWSAVQVSLFLLPAALLYAVASRRSPVSGACVASMSLGLAVAFSLLALVPRGRLSVSTPAKVAESKPELATIRSKDIPAKPASFDVDGPGWSTSDLRGIWNRFEVAASVPADHCRPWGRTLAFVGMAGTGVGLLRIIAGVYAVRVCRRRSVPVNDAAIIDLVDELRISLGCRRRVEVRETPELTTPATAGWLRAVVFLPDGWRTWDGQERRAVFAHELAHVCHADYATGLLARVALALHFYHPLVHWLAARLQLEQELAADALGAKFAGGKALYLQSLSRLVLRQDGQSPCWPARAFLPAKGTLIRRIAMLRDETKTMDRPWSGSRRILVAMLLLIIAGAASLLHGPARGDDGDVRDDAVKTVKLVIQPADRDHVEPFDLSYMPDDAQCIVAFRPKDAFGRAGMGKYRVMLNLLVGQQWALAANHFGFDPSKPGQGPLRIEMFEQVATMATFSRTGGKKPDGRFSFGDVLSARTTEPIDWWWLFRTFKQEPTEVREGHHVYYKVQIPALGPDSCFYFPDDRTIVFASEKRLLKLLRRPTPAPAPVFAGAKDWDRFLHGLLMVACNNQDGGLANVLKATQLEEGEEPDFDVAALFERADQWIFGLDIEDTIQFRGVATCPDEVVSEVTARATENEFARVGKEIDTALNPANQEIATPKSEKPPPRTEEQKLIMRMARAFFKKLHVEREGCSVLVRSSGIGTFAELASLIASQVTR